YSDRINKVASKRERLKIIDDIKIFKYNPNGDNISKDSLNHSEVIEICSDFLSKKPLMQSLLISKYPVLLIDESQDTKAQLMDALLTVQNHHEDKFILGLFGDVMQRIYGDGKSELQSLIPLTWKKPVKTINYRCPTRIIQLLNKIRSSVDDHVQSPSTSNKEGIIRLFISNANAINKQEI